MRGCELRAQGAHRAGWSKLAIAIAAGVLALAGAAQAQTDPGRGSFALPPVMAEQPDDPSVFGTVPVPVRVKPTSTRWSRIMRASLNQPALLDLAAAAAGLAPEAQADFVQQRINLTVRNRSPSYDCSDDGYWAPAGETLGRRTGDCIDIAIAKMEALRLLGVPARDLYLTTGYAGAGGGERGRESAALLVRLNGAFWLLTERDDHVIPASAPQAWPDFAPIITYGVGRTWIHGKLMRTPPPGSVYVAASPQPVSAVAR